MSPPVHVTFALDHPTASGHFPGDPIIPGAVLLETVLGALESAGQSLERGVRLTSAKVLAPVRPGDSIEILWQPIVAGRTRFECRVGERRVVQGALEFPGP